MLLSAPAGASLTISWQDPYQARGASCRVCRWEHVGLLPATTTLRLRAHTLTSQLSTCSRHWQRALHPNRVLQACSELSAPCLGVLQDLKLNDNQFSGPIPSSWGRLSSLSTMWVSTAADTHSQTASCKAQQAYHVHVHVHVHVAALSVSVCEASLRV